MLRRTKDAVLDQLPPKRRLVQEIDADDEVYRKLMEPAMEAARRLRDAQTSFDRTRIEDEICQRMRQATGRSQSAVCRGVCPRTDRGRRKGTAVCTPSSGDGRLPHRAARGKARLYHGARNHTAEG